MIQKIISTPKKLMLFGISLVLYVLSIYAPIGLVISVFIMINRDLPRHISMVEYAFLALAMLLVVPVYLWRKKIKKIN